MTTEQLVKSALRKLSVLGDGQSPSTTQYDAGVEALNAMLKTFVVKGMPLWAITEQDVPLIASTSEYEFGESVLPAATPAPLKVLQAVLKDLTAETSIPMNVRTHYDFNLLSNQASEGTPNTYWYEPLNQTGILHIWPLPDSYSVTNRVITLVYQRPFYDMIDVTDTLDFPQWWHDAVIWGLAFRLAPEYGIPLQDRKNLGLEAQFFLEEALSFGEEEGSMYFQPDWVTK